MGKKLLTEKLREMLYKQKYEADIKEFCKSSKTLIGITNQDEIIRNYNAIKNTATDVRLDKVVPAKKGFCEITDLTEFHEQLVDMQIFEYLQNTYASQMT